MTERPSEQPTDDELIADLLDRLVEDLSEGHDIDADKLLVEYPHLRERVLETYELAREIAVTAPASKPQLQGYEIVRELGRGGMGTVYLARHAGLDREIALKVLPTAVALSKRARRRFLVEARALAGLHDEHIVKIHRILDRDDVLAYEMEWIEGRTLRELLDTIRRKGRRATAKDIADALGGQPTEIEAGGLVSYVARVGIAVARALARVHDAGLIHRDVKPSNILLRTDGTPVLADFGLARGSDSSMTRTGAFVGTPIYAPPEQLRADGHKVDARSDVYSLGVTLYEAIAFQPPFEGTTSVEILEKIEAGLKPLHRVAPEVPRDLSIIVQKKAIEPEPDYRYGTADELACDLQRLLQLQPIHAQPASMLRRAGKLVRRNRRPVLGITVGVLVAAAALVPFLFRGTPAEAAQRAEAAVVSARTELLSLEVLQWAWEKRAGGGQWRTEPQWGDRLHHAIEAYDRALGLGWEDERVRFERALCELVAYEVANPMWRNDAMPRHLELTRAAMEHAGPLTAKWLTITHDRHYRPDLTRERVASASTADRAALGLVAYLRGAFGRCELAWDGLAMESVSPLVNAGLGAIYVLDGRSAAAYGRLNRALAELPQAGHLMLLLGDAALANNELADAEGWLERARQFEGSYDAGNPARARFSSHRRRLEADVLAARGDATRAREELEGLREERPEWSDVSYRLAELDRQAGDLAAAADKLRDLCTHHPDVARYRLAAAHVAIQREDFFGYVAQARHALSENFGSDRTRGTIRDRLLILRSGSLTELFSEGVDATGLTALRAVRGPTPRPLTWGLLDSREEVEEFVRRLAAFDRIDLQQWPLKRWSRFYGDAVSACVRACLLFPQVVPSSDSFTRGVVQLTAGLACAHWNTVKHAIPAVLGALHTLVHGPPTHRLLELTVRVKDGESYYGVAIAGVGDIDGDGCADLAVARAIRDVVEVRAGSTDRVLRRIETPVVVEMFSRGVFRVGDVDRDGISDLLVHTRDAQEQSILEVYSLAPDPPQLLAAVPTVYREIRAVPAGDVDGDGWPDIAVAPRNHEGALDVVVAIHSGRRIAQRTGSGPLAELAAPEGVRGFGRSLASIGDLDGDGRPELAICSSEPGDQVCVYSIRPRREIAGIAQGTQVAGPGDIDGDGLPDLFVGFEGYGARTHGRGKVWLYSGASLAAGTQPQVLWEHEGQAGDWIGTRCAGVGDVDGDGVPDLAFGAEQWGGENDHWLDNLGGYVDIVSGRDFRRLHREGGVDLKFRFGRVGRVGDVDGDGRADVLAWGLTMNRVIRIE